MRARQSFFGPIVLIALGGLLLAHNLYPQIRLARLFADYWPWILIVWGGFRLAEFGVARARGRRGPQPLGAGAVVVALLLCLAGSTAHSLARNEFEFVDWLRVGGWFDGDYPRHYEQAFGTGHAIRHDPAARIGHYEGLAGIVQQLPRSPGRTH